MKASTGQKLWMGLAALLAPAAALAQDAVADAAASAANAAAAVTAPDRIAELEQKIAAAQMAGDNTWLMVSSALVLMMTAPGLFLFYGGLVRAKNVLSVFMQCFFLMAAISIIWMLYGYSLAFAPGNAFLGGTEYVLLNGVGAEPSGYAATVPHTTFMFFQMMFAIITPGLICGAFAERFRFKAFVPFMILWFTVVYLPVAHMVWGEGGYLNAFLGPENKIPALDFAGGTVVHISSGVSALVLSILLGKRHGYPGHQFAPHSLVLSGIGAGLLWVGWFGFNAGSAVSAGSLASSAFIATHLSACGATISWMVAEWILRGKPSFLGAISGAVAGLVAVTPAAGFVTPVSGLVIGLIGGFLCFFACVKVKGWLGYDDALDVFGVHGVGGITGAVLTGVFAHSSVNAVFGEGPVGLLEGNSMQVVNQILAVLITIIISVVGTVVIYFLVNAVVRAKATPEEQEQGLDIADHGEMGYHEARS